MNEGNVGTFLEIMGLTPEADMSYGFKILSPYGSTYFENKETFYPLPPGPNVWGEWLEHPEPATPDGDDCGRGGYHLMKRPDFRYHNRANGSPWPWLAQYRLADVLGETGEKVRVTRLRLMLITRDQFTDALKHAKWTSLNLMDANLWGVDLLGSILWGTELIHVDLRDADLRDAELLNANLMNADLRGAILRGANLLGADLRDADLRHADLTTTILTNANLRDANLWNANLWNAHLTGANLRDANLTDANLTDANLRDADLMNANLTDANLTNADLRGAQFQHNGTLYTVAK